MQTSIADVLRSHGYRVTTPRQRVFDALLRAEEPLSIVELATRCEDVDSVSVYRTIDLFERLYLVQVVTRGWRQSYELAEPFRPHHHHLVCRRCQQVTSVSSELLEQLIGRLSDAEDFLVQEHHFEVSGLCSRCRHLKDV